MVEFKYKRKSVFVYSLVLLIGLGVFVWRVISGIWLHRLGISMFFLGLAVLGYTGLSHVIKNRNTIIHIDENRISLQSNDSPTTIFWKEVTEAKIRIYFMGVAGTHFIGILSGLLNTASFSITIKSDTNEMLISSDINNIEVLVDSMKKKLGNKFDTSKLPMKYKTVIKEKVDKTIEWGEED